MNMEQIQLRVKFQTVKHISSEFKDRKEQPQHYDQRRKGRLREKKHTND